MIDESCCKEKFQPIKKFVKYLKYKFKFAKENPNYFYADGLTAFVGAQGSGKTLSAVNYVYNLLEKYPNSKLVTNLELKDYPVKTFNNFLVENKNIHSKLIEEIGIKKANEILEELYKKKNRVFQFVDNDDFKKYNNDDKGVIFLVDEIQLYMNSLQSKNINLDVITQISQQRKQRKHIVCTSQVFGRMAKPLREQFSCIIVCKNYLGFIQCNKLIDRDSIEDEQNTTGTELRGKVKRKFWFIHSPEYYKKYDTYKVIEKGKFVAGEEQKQEIYNKEEKKEVIISECKSKRNSK